MSNDSTTTTIHSAEARRRFREFAQGEIGDHDLVRGALLIAMEDDTGVDMDDCFRRLDDLAARVRRRSSPGEPPVFTLGHLHAEMFDVDGFHGDAENYYDPRNAQLHQVLQRKQGIPILLAIVFLHVARSIGLTAFGVGLPGHYIVKVQFDLNEVYVDPFHGGAMLTLHEVAELISGMAGGRERLSSEHLRAWDARRTLIRVLANLQNMWMRAGDPVRAAAAADRMTLLDTPGTAV